MSIHEFRGPEADGSFVIRFPNIARGKQVKAQTLGMDHLLLLVQRAEQAVATGNAELPDEDVIGAWEEAGEPCTLPVFSEVYRNVWELAIRSALAAQGGSA